MVMRACRSPPGSVLQLPPHPSGVHWAPVPPQRWRWPLDGGDEGRPRLRLYRQRVGKTRRRQGLAENDEPRVALNPAERRKSESASCFRRPRGAAVRRGGVKYTAPKRSEASAHQPRKSAAWVPPARAPRARRAAAAGRRADPRLLAAHPSGHECAASEDRDAAATAALPPREAAPRRGCRPRSRAPRFLTRLSRPPAAPREPSPLPCAAGNRSLVFLFLFITA